MVTDKRREQQRLGSANYRAKTKSRLAILIVTVKELMAEVKDLLTELECNKK